MIFLIFSNIENIHRIFTGTLLLAIKLDFKICPASNTLKRNINIIRKRYSLFKFDFSYHNYQLTPSFDGNGQTKKLIKNAKRDRKGPVLKNCALSINVATINRLLRIQTDPDFEQLITQQK